MSIKPAPVSPDDVLIAHVEVPDKPVELVALCDPAIDTDRLTDEIRAAYAASHDRSILPLKPGKVPVVFEVAVLGAGEAEDIEARALGQATQPDGRVSHLEAAMRSTRAFFDRAVIKARNVAQFDEARPEGEQFFRGDVTKRELLHLLPGAMRREIGTVAQTLCRPKLPVRPTADAGK